MHFSDRTVSAVIAAAFVFVLISLTGCTGGTNLFAYTVGEAQFTLVFPSVSGDTDGIRASCIRDENGNVTLTVTDPPRLAGFTVTCTDGTVCAGMDDTGIPLSRDAAQGLTAVFDTLTMTGTAVKSPDGTATIITAPTGTVTLNEELHPVSVDAGDVSVKVEGWSGTE